MSYITLALQIVTSNCPVVVLMKEWYKNSSNTELWSSNLKQYNRNRYDGFINISDSHVDNCKYTECEHYKLCTAIYNDIERRLSE